MSHRLGIVTYRPDPSDMTPRTLPKCAKRVLTPSACKWPQNIWSVSDDGLPLEAQLENPEKGIYHGYPMPESDPLASEVIRRWEMAQDEV